MTEPLGHVTGMGLVVGRTLTRPTPWIMPKCEVVPVSITEGADGGSVVGKGGPGGVAEELGSFDFDLTDGFKRCSSLAMLLPRGSPRPYSSTLPSALLALLVGRRRGLSSRNLLVSRGLRRILLLPPFMSRTVASSW